MVSVLNVHFLFKRLTTETDQLLTDYGLFPNIVANTQSSRLIFGLPQVLLNKSVNLFPLFSGEREI